MSTEKKTNEAREKTGFKTYLGVTLMSMMDCVAAGLMTSWFMQYLTDYAGIGALAAVIGTVILLVMRLFDAVNDPIEGWIMDRAKVGKYGKYKPFIIISILFEAVGLSCLFFIPESITLSPVGVIVWILVAYLIYDIGASFFAPNLIYRTLTLDSQKRGKLMVAPRILTMIIGMVTGSLIAIVGGVNAGIGNMHKAFGITVLAGAAFGMIISLIGILLVKEKYHAPQSETSTKKVKIKDIFVLFKENDALRVRFSAGIFSGFIWTFLFATMLYYIKWAYSADLTTGVVDTAKYGTLSLIASMMMLIPLLLGTAIAMPIMKAFKTPVRTYKFVIIGEAIPCGLLFVMQIIGVLPNSPAIFLALVGIAATFIGIGYIPGESLNIECMDYEIYKNGKDRSALVNATAKFLDKAQNAVSSSLVGIVLVAVGYVVNSATDTYTGELSAIPGMLNWFIVIMGLIPFILGIISFIIYRKYPITAEIAEEMKLKLTATHAADKES